MASLSVTSLQHRCRARIGAGAVAMSALAVAACGSDGSGVVGLPAEDFDRAYTAGLDVAAAERCGAGVDAGLVRYNLVEDASAEDWPRMSRRNPGAPSTRRGWNSPSASHSARTIASVATR